MIFVFNQGRVFNARASEARPRLRIRAQNLRFSPGLETWHSDSRTSQRKSRNFKTTIYDLLLKSLLLIRSVNLKINVKLKGSRECSSTKLG